MSPRNCKQWVMASIFTRWNQQHLAAGMSSDNSCVTRASNATTCLGVKPNGDTTRSGNLDTHRITLNKPSSDSETPLKSSITTKAGN